VDERHIVYAVQSKTFIDGRMTVEEEQAYGPIICASIKNGIDFHLSLVLRNPDRRDKLYIREVIDSFTRIRHWLLPLEIFSRRSGKITERQLKVIPMLPFFNNRFIEKVTAVKYNTVRNIRSIVLKEAKCKGDAQLLLYMMNGMSSGNGNEAIE
jgi:hypothetical protein